MHSKFKSTDDTFHQNGRIHFDAYFQKQIKILNLSNVVPMTVTVIYVPQDPEKIAFKAEVRFSNNFNSFTLSI